MNISSREEYIPLTPQAGAVLLALADGPKHGYWIVQLCRSDSDDMLVMSTGSIYPILERLKAQKLIEEFRSEIGTSSPFKRKMYMLTGTGKMVLEREMDRQANFVALVRFRLKKHNV